MLFLGRQPAGLSPGFVSADCNHREGAGPWSFGPIFMARKLRLLSVRESASRTRFISSRNAAQRSAADGWLARGFAGELLSPARRLILSIRFSSPRGFHPARIIFVEAGPASTSSVRIY